MLTEVTRRLKLIERQETDILRWSEPASLQTSWDKRTPFAAALCRQSKAICDIGCGNQRLRALLPPAIRYLPADLTRRTPDTALCDLNEKMLPEEYLREADTATLLGVVEYVYDVAWLIDALRPFLGVLIVSYNPADMIDNNRCEKGWVNDYRLDEFADMIVRAGYTLRDVNMVDPGQVVIAAISAA
jgi:hypothetical protein